MESFISKPAFLARILSTYAGVDLLPSSHELNTRMANTTAIVQLGKWCIAFDSIMELLELCRAIGLERVFLLDLEN